MQVSVCRSIRVSSPRNAASQDVPGKTYASAMTLRDQLRICDSAVRSHLDAEEQVMAVGRCEDITTEGTVERGGAGWTFVMVTSHRLRWVPRAKLENEASLAFDDVTAAFETSLGHRYGIALEHAPISRRHRRQHRFLHSSWANPMVTMRLTRTKLAFSRRDTKAAIALREQVSRRLHL
jgi:hypothetical protein